MIDVTPNKSYRKRHVDSLIENRLESAGAIVIEGARATGKTFTGRHHAASYVFVDEMLETQPAIAEFVDRILVGPAPRLIDEWQVLPSIWNRVRRQVDERQLPGQFILTGSAIPQDSVTRHSGAGRFSRIRMRPMSISESTGFTPTIRLSDLFSAKAHFEGGANHDLIEIIKYLVTGGWPGNQTGALESRIQWVRDYVTETARVDLALFETAGRRRDPQKVLAVIRSIARNVGSPSKNSRIVSDTVGSDESVSASTVSSYLDALRRIMVLEEIPSWRPHLRSKVSIRAMPKQYFVDPSIAAAALSVHVNDLVNDLAYTGLLFENLVMRDLLIYADVVGASVSYYRDDTGLEVDAIIESPAGKWIAIEIKLGNTMVDQAATSLLRLVTRLDATRMPKPEALIVITARGYAHTRPDGVHVVPFSLIGP